LPGESALNTGTRPAANTANDDAEIPGNGTAAPSSAKLTNPRSNAASHSAEEGADASGGWGHWPQTPFLWSSQT
jgi:hypothetical protein